MIRIGILGAAKIAPPALIEPAKKRVDCQVVCVAARETGRARAYADQHGIPEIAEGYDALIARPDIDLIYNALPPHRHADLTIAALEAGKAVLCEKPFAMNAREAQRMVDAAVRNGRPLAEAFHYRFHPMFGEILTQLRSGAIGKLCAIHWARTVAGSEPEVIEAACALSEHGADLVATAKLAFEGGVTAQVRTSMAPGRTFKALLAIQGTGGLLVARPPLHPHRGHSIPIRNAAGARGCKADGQTTYDQQLAHMIDVMNGKAPPLTGGADAVANMALINAVYAAAGVPRPEIGRAHV